MNKVIDKYLVFRIDDDNYAISVNDTKEIVRMMSFTSIPKAPEFIKGVINIRGRIIPLIDLRIKFGLSGTIFENDSCVFIIMEASDSGKAHSIALIVDKVTEIATIMPDEIKPPDYFVDACQSEFLSGKAIVNGKTIMILNSSGIMNTNNMETADII
jgi:purine-binding chemotaxis protein CheW